MHFCDGDPGPTLGHDDFRGRPFTTYDGRTRWSLSRLLTQSGHSPSIKKGNDDDREVRESKPTNYCSPATNLNAEHKLRDDLQKVLGENAIRDCAEQVAIALLALCPAYCHSCPLKSFSAKRGRSSVGGFTSALPLGDLPAGGHAMSALGH